MKKIIISLLLVILSLTILVGCNEPVKTISLPNLDGMSREEISNTLDAKNIKYKFHFSEDIIYNETYLDKFVKYGNDLEADDKVEEDTLIHVYTTVLPLPESRLDEVTMDFEVSSQDSFVRDGVAIVTLVRAIDGDTARFYDANGANADERNLYVRFLGIDTPESTKENDPWGKSASNYVSKRLNNAKEIILESTNIRKDIYDRYLAFVWVDGKLLNLELIEQAYSNSTITSNTKYGNIFLETAIRVSMTGRRFYGETDPTYHN